MAKGRVILLNGTSSSGKSTVARALQQVLDEPFLHANADAIKEMCSGIPDSSAGNAFDRWAYLPRLYSAIPACFAALAAAGNNLIIDDVLRPLQLKNYVESLSGFAVLFVGVLCSEEELCRRERERGDRRAGRAAEQLASGLIHSPGIYDITVDTSLHPPESCALLVKQHLLERPEPTAFERLAQVRWDDLYQATDKMDQAIHHARESNAGAE